jgi:hypothetical protein
MDTTTAPTADLVVLDDVTALDNSDNEGTSNTALGAVCLAAGVAIGTFVVPPVVGFVKSWFTKPQPTIEAQVEEVMAPAKTETPKKKEAV